jgi:glycosyltransferase involved in cell wall biosynthesis
MEAHDEPRVTLVHDWLTGMRGGEKCLEALCERWSEAELLTLLRAPGSINPVIESRPISTTFLQHFPGVEHYYRYLLPLMPWAASTWRVPASDLLVSLSHCVAKAVPVPAGVPHVCYCFTPMRYAWHMREAYFGPDRLGKMKAMLIGRVLEDLRNWDRRTAQSVTHFVAISRTVQARIRQCYDRESAVIYPPVDTEFYSPEAIPRENYYLAVSAFAPYKRLDLAIGACKRLRRSLVLIGSGQEAKRLRRHAGPDVVFLGRQPDECVRDHMRRCRALLFPGEEDFGITPVEAMACGTPVIAYGQGGACETVIPLSGSAGREAGIAGEPTGIWFEEQTSECLASAIEQFEAHTGGFSAPAVRRQALRFNRDRFKNEFFGFVAAVLDANAPSTARRAA